MRKLSSMKHLVFVIIITLLYAFSFILIDFSDTPVKSFNDVFVTSLKWGYMSAATFILLYFLSVNKYLFALTFPILSLACTALAYYRLTLHVELTLMVIDLALVNDFRTSMDAISWQLMAALFFVFVIAICLVVYRWKKITVHHEWIHLLLSACVLIGINIPYALSQPLQHHTPYSIYYAFKSYSENKRVIAEERPAFKADAQCHSDSLTVVFVLGESLRAKNMQLNGYERHTNPYMSKEKNIVSLPNVYSEYGYTHESVPYIMSRADHDNPDLGYEEHSFISILRQAGYHTAWLANQEPIITFVYFMNECDSLVNISNGKSSFIYSEWLDEDILPHYKNILSEQHNRQFMLVHTIGSHWYYNNHYPDNFMIYKPVITSKVISSNSHEEMVNAYDNTIVYSDYIWYQLINELRDRNAILIYLADHSENMGEDGHYTHGDGDWTSQHEPACFVWYSDKYASYYPEKISRLKANKDKKYNTSFLFHSILDAADVTSSYINSKEDIFK